MSHYWKAPLFASPFILCLSAKAEPLEAFQTGPVGNGYGYSVVSGLQSEVKFETTNEFGSMTFDQIPNEKLSSQTLNSKFSAATGYRASSQFYIMGYTDILVKSHSQETRIDNSSLSSGANYYEFGAKAIFEKGPLSLGGRIGLHNVGGEERVLKTAGQTYTSEASWAAIPQLEVSAGYRIDKLANFVRFKFFSQGEYEVETDNNGSSIIYDSKRKLPAELAVSSLYDFNELLQLGGGFKLIAAEQASSSTTPWSRQFDSSGRRQDSTTKMNTNQVVASVGGKFFPTSLFSLAASLEYQTDKFASDSKASVEESNFGGMGMTFQTEFIPNKVSRIHARTSYFIPRSVSYTKNKSEDAVLSHQEITTGDGSRANVRLGKFAIALGGTYMF